MSFVWLLWGLCALALLVLALVAAAAVRAARMKPTGAVKADGPAQVRRLPQGAAAHLPQAAPHRRNH